MQPGFIGIAIIGAQALLVSIIAGAAAYNLASTAMPIGAMLLFFSAAIAAFGLLTGAYMLLGSAADSANSSIQRVACILQIILAAIFPAMATHWVFEHTNIDEIRFVTVGIALFVAFRSWRMVRLLGGNVT